MKNVFIVYFALSVTICFFTLIFKGFDFKLNVNDDYIVSEELYKEALKDYKNENRIFYISLIATIIFPRFIWS